MQRELDKAWRELPGRTLIQSRGNTGEHGIIYKDDREQGTYLMIGSSWCFRSPMKGTWQYVGEVRDFVVLAHDLPPHASEDAVLKLCGYKKDKAGNVVPIK